MTSRAADTHPLKISLTPRIFTPKLSGKGFD
jgi:hypothetical protein